MSCQRCKSENVNSVHAKCSDMCSINNDEPNYVPQDIKIGGGDYIKFSYCLDCGQIQGDNFIQPKSTLPVGQRQLLEFVVKYINDGRNNDAKSSIQAILDA